MLANAEDAVRNYATQIYRALRVAFLYTLFRVSYVCIITGGGVGDALEYSAHEYGGARIPVPLGYVVMGISSFQMP